MDHQTSHPRLGGRFDNALVFAVRKHRTQVRKGSEVPYAGHLLGVCSLVIEDGGSEDEAIAALLHDVVEDQGGELVLEEVRAQFDEQVAAIVLACSDTTVDPKPPWRERKEAYLAHLTAASLSTLRVSLADKLYNARAILRDRREVGDAVWDRFNTGRDGQLWYYGALADAFVDLRPGPMATELTETVDAIRSIGPD